MIIDGDQETQENLKPKLGVNGLKNLGNSCYINAAFTCLFQIQPLVDYFLSDLHLQEVNVDNPLSTKGAITRAFGPIAK